MAWAEEQACRGSGRVSEPKQGEGGVREKGLPAVGGGEAASAPRGGGCSGSSRMATCRGIHPERQ